MLHSQELTVTPCHLASLQAEGTEHRALHPSIATETGWPDSSGRLPSGCSQAGRANRREHARPPETVVMGYDCLGAALDTKATFTFEGVKRPLYQAAALEVPQREDSLAWTSYLRGVPSHATTGRPHAPSPSGSPSHYSGGWDRAPTRQVVAGVSSSAAPSGDNDPQAASTWRPSWRSPRQRRYHHGRLVKLLLGPGSLPCLCHPG